MNCITVDIATELVYSEIEVNQIEDETSGQFYVKPDRKRYQSLSTSIQRVGSDSDTRQVCVHDADLRFQDESEFVETTLRHVLSHLRRDRDSIRDDISIKNRLFENDW